MSTHIDSNPPVLQATRPPRCPHFHEITDAEQLLPYLEAVARRPYHQGLHASWDLQQGERVLLKVDNWYDPMVIDACKHILEKYGCEYEIESRDLGEQVEFEGWHEADGMIARTHELRGDIKGWKELEEAGRYDKILWGFGGPVFTDGKIKVQRMPFITPEYLASPAHTLPGEVLKAIDEHTWDRICKARRVRISDPEGTDISFTNNDAFYNSDRSHLNDAHIDSWFGRTGTTGVFRSYLPGHVWGRPNFMLPEFEDGTGVLAGTMNHYGPFPFMKLAVENSKVVRIEGGGRFGDRLREIDGDTAGVQYPGLPEPGIMWWWEASIGTNPKIHRPREGYLRGHGRSMFERMRSGVIHLGFGTVVCSDPEGDAHEAGLMVGHWHIHIYFPTFAMEMVDGTDELLIDRGRLTALDAPGVRDIAAKYGDPDEMLQEDWIPAVPGINLDGDYFSNYANDPLKWTQAELNICRNWHDLYMKMIS